MMTSDSTKTADQSVRNEVTSDTSLGSSFAQPTSSTRRRAASRTSNKLDNHGTSTLFLRAQPIGEGILATRGTGYGATQQGD